MQTYPANHPGCNETGEIWLTLDEVVEACAGADGLPQTLNAMRAAVHETSGGQGGRKRPRSLGEFEFPIVAFPDDIVDHVRKQQAKARQSAEAAARAERESQERERRELWRRFEAKSRKLQEDAAFRSEAVIAYRALVDDGIPTVDAKRQVGSDFGRDPTTILLWSNQVRGIPREDWLPHLAFDFRAAPWAENFADVVDFFAAELCRPERPSYEASYRKLEKEAAVRGWSLPHINTLRRHVKRPKPVA